MEEIKEALHPLMVEVLKFLAVVISALLINILTIARNNVKHNFLKNKALNWAVNKAIKLEGGEFKKLTNEQRWQTLIKWAGVVGITEQNLLELEAEIMGKVTDWKNNKK